jgi:4-hydroxy-2-oxoheptanedioate aldolase
MIYARKNKLKEKLAKGEMVMGMEMWFRDPRVVELLGYAGFDFVHIECEHVGRDWTAVENDIRAAELSGLTPLYRTEQTFDGEPPVNEIIKALKLGAQIIMVPQVSTPEAAKKAVAAAKYPPAGRRGIATCDRSSKQIFPTPAVPLDTQVCVREANDEIMVWAIIETPEGVANIDAILDVEGIDAVGFGHQDYAIAAGLSADNGALVDEAREKVREAAKRHGKPMWWNTDQVSVVEEERKKGMQIMLFGCDIIHMDNLFHKIISDCKHSK